MLVKLSWLRMLIIIIIFIHQINGSNISIRNATERLNLTERTITQYTVIHKTYTCTDELQIQNRPTHLLCCLCCKT